MTTSRQLTASQPHRLAVSEVIQTLETDVDSGLSHEEAARRLEQYGRNELEAAEGPSVWNRIAGQFSDPLVIMLFVAMLISLAAWFY